MKSIRTALFLSMAILLFNCPASAQSEPPVAEAAQKEADVLAGHSYHGDAFNEGPRQKAYLMEGTGKVDFPVTIKDPLAQRFVNQGVGQLHGFWYFEAERSFRQAAALDPDCAMAYWGMAMSNTNNEKRAKGFIAEAVERRSGITQREQLYVDALDGYLKAGKGKAKERSQAYVKALEKILHEYPDDIEARAFLALQLWLNRLRGLPISSHFAVDALLQQVFQAEPMHPAYHYRIHLWDYERPETALNSAARCGQASPAIAHMWHMPGHIYSRLKRYGDAAWQQEASARVDHAHMMRDRVMPDQIHNFAHNNEWLIRNLMNVGRVRDGVDLAKNMIELPRHPKYNTLRGGSARYGRQRLFDVLSRYELWEEMIALCNSPYLAPTDNSAEQVKRLCMLGSAYLRKGDANGGARQLAALQERLQKETDAREKAVAEAAEDGKDESGVNKAKTDAMKPFDRRIADVEKAIKVLQGHQAVAAGDFQKGHALLKDGGYGDRMYLARLQLMAGEKDEAIKQARAVVDSRKGEVQPLAQLVDLLWQAGEKQQAAGAFGELRSISEHVDLQSPVFSLLSAIGTALGYEGDWRLVQGTPEDVGQRPELDTLGPFRWQPSPAPEWTLKDADGQEHSLSAYRGRPVIVIFYLGYGCLHCVRQLQAFAPMTDEFGKAGIELIAISTDDPEGLRKSVEASGGDGFPFPLVSNAALDVFKAYRAYDDFENLTLHGTFVVDGEGLVRWQDISYEPFMDGKFLLEEAQRLLAQKPPGISP